MACSKLFSGYLPELIDEIIQYFRNDISTLHSCILVNRLWCRSAISLLWEDPFSLIHVQNFRFVEIYLRNLNEDDKAKLNEYGINNNLLLLSSTLFNYPSFIKRLNTHKVGHSIENWLSTLMDNNYDKRRKAAKLVYKLLFKMFIENEGSLYSFEVKMHTISDYKYFNDTMELTLQNPNFTCNIRNLIFYIFIMYGCRNLFPSTNILPFLNFLHSNCNSITSFYFGIFKFEAGNFSSIGNCLSQMIITQQNLKKISFECNDFFYNSFSLLKNSNISNTLKIITFYSIDFNIIISNFKEIFNQFNVLESIHIIYCKSLNSQFIQQMVSVIIPFKLKTLIISEILQVESLQLLLQRFGNDLENFGFNSCDYDFSNKELIQNNINLTLSLIENIKQNLNYLSIEIDFFVHSLNYNIICSIVLQNLGQILPSKLEFLRLGLKIGQNDLKIFLENSKNTFINRLFIRNMYYDINEDILSCIKEYIMKKKRVKYLAIYNIYQDLIDLKGEVNEFKLYDIIIQRYEDFFIQTYDIVNSYL
ncbi:hypothetical protein RhiirC2_849074 [Rhizophagus irregularis]|uniref:F-box domain-containing protein n=1 Tax=Rhizophagus irregularis TaxID=588596 RepID=A0A2N1NCQ2_9GLOM|nr:hypothetical protein RhiirC2_849074 [Rhizophagus irregularis]